MGIYYRFFCIWIWKFVIERNILMFFCFVFWGILICKGLIFFLSLADLGTCYRFFLCLDLEICYWEEWGIVHERLVAARRGQSWEKRWEAWGSWLAQSREMRWEEWGTVCETLKTPCPLLKGNLVIANSPPMDISNAHELLTKWTIRAPNIKRVFSSQI